MKGRRVEVGIANRTGTDAFGHQVLSFEWIAVGDVLIDPRPMETESTDSGVHDPLVENEIIFHFPKGFNADLTNARIRAFGHEYAVVGNPIPYPEELTPTRWNLPVRARRADSA